ncbi:MAG: rod shape-determining protein RodA [Clostridiales bacterium]|jgi:rod shape determining protein RodA|nr:rod shape-determining protein RodA [Clostridiales bacterium]OPZ69391.1 MAG: Rod shape-determining protein RodA [Firmicutes bacterium ADurb.Bin467]
MRAKLTALLKQLRLNKFDRSLMRYFDWPLFLIVLVISLFGVVCIFSASTISVTQTPSTVMEMLETQPVTYARLQLIWLGAGLLAMMAIIYFGYDLYGHYANTFYILNIVLLVVVLGMDPKRGGMTAFFTWGSTAERTFQPSEVGKVAMIIAFARAFSARVKPVMHVRDLIPLVIYMGIPLTLIVAQPDVGTALVYLAVFSIMVFVSGTNYKLLLAVMSCIVLLVIPVWYFMNSSDNFRMMRILIWLDPESYPDYARQVINAQTAVGSGGMWGKGIVSPGSFASLGYISDDHTDFIFAICCESFGMVGASALVLLYALLLGRMFYLSTKAADAFGAYLIIGVASMLTFHIVENIAMVIGLLPVTGIPLPFMSYGGSNMITNMLGIGLVMNVVMRSRNREVKNRIVTSREIRL